jgi:hypothetical protein
MKFLALSLLALAPLAFAQTMPTGWINIVSKNSGKCLDILGGLNSLTPGIHADQWTCSGPTATNEIFRFIPAGTGYRLQVNRSGLSLQPLNGSTANTTAIVQNPYTGAHYQNWKAVASGTGYYSLRPLSAPSSCMDVNGRSLLDQAAVQEYSCWGGANQAWKFVPITMPSAAHTVALSWTASTSPSVSYNIYRATASGAFAKIASGVTGTSYSDTTVASATTYQYQATAIDAGNNESGYSNTISVIVPSN